MHSENIIKMTEDFNPQRVIEEIAYIGKFHRIQGSEGLVKAAEHIHEEVKNLGLKTRFIVEYYDGERVFANMKTPIAWEPIYGEVQIQERKITTEKSMLVIMAHSPPGEAEGEIKFVEHEEDWGDVKGKIVVVDEDWRDNYRKACEHGAIGYIIYRKGLQNAIPYVGLFLSKEDLRWAKIPAVAIDENWAVEIKNRIKRGEKVKGKILVKSKIKDKEILPIIYATIGKPPYILFSAHLCHPEPGANDNASGSAMLLELARILKRIYDESFRFGFAFLWIPEHIGSGAFIENHAKVNDFYGAINLDMVGGDRIMLIRAPLSRFSVLSGVVEYFLEIFNSAPPSMGRVPEVISSVNPYHLGSDHDIFNFFEIPAITLITWPDPYYHSSEDSVDKLNKRTVEIIGRCALASALFLSKEALRDFARAYAMKYLGELGMHRKIRISKYLVNRGLYRDGKYLSINIGKEMQENGWLLWSKKGMISPQNLKGEKEKSELKEIYKDRRNMVLLHELLMLSEVLDKKRCFKALSEEYGDYKKDVLMKAIEILQNEGFIKLI